MATCLVTGGSGFLGSHLCDHLLAKGYRVICVDNFDTGNLKNIAHIKDGNNFRFVQADIIRHYEIDESLDFVYHMASPASPIDYARLPLHTLKVGAYGTHNTLGLAKAKRARFLLASTSEVYGDPEIHPQKETYWGNVNPIGPRGVYDEAKRYAEAMTMAYLRQQGVDTAIARIFNSVLADEQLLYDDGRELRRETAAALAERLAAYGRIAVYAGQSTSPTVAAVVAPGQSAAEDAREFPLEAYTVPAFASDGTAIAASADAFIAHPTRQRCFHVRTRYGRGLKVTGDHSVFVEGRDGEPVPKPVIELEVGDRIAIARRIEVPERDRTEVDMLEVWHRAEHDPWDLTVEAPGLGALAWAKREDLFGLLVSERRSESPNWRKGAWTKLIRMRESDRLPLPVLRRLGAAVPRGAKVRQRFAGRSVAVPARIEITDDLLWFLGLWVAEGSRFAADGDAFITLSADDALLDRAEAVVRESLGLHVVRVPGSNARAAAMFVHSKLLLALLDFLGFEGKGKRVPGWILGLPLPRLKWFIEGYREGDGVHSGEKFDEGRRHEFSTVSTELKDDLVVALARFGLVPSVSRYESYKGDRAFPFWRLTMCHVAPWSPLEWDKVVTQKLNARVTGDLVWASVDAIGEVDATPLVYDFCVPGYENFWAGGVMAHNTYGPRMRPHDGRAIPTFLRQALSEKPVTVFGDGMQTRSFCYVDDLVRGLILLMESGVHEPVNIGNPNEMTLLEMAKLVIELTESRSEIVFEALPIDDPKVRQPDISRAKDLLGWEPEVDLREGLRKTIDHAMEQLARPV
ncbi:MAG TPA: NAD-dependent epimerase/dehydratase family protein [Thermoleophilaceae bacterium]|jgi:nucleoside-diphosphate-sugar epimerase|nr:NAD-dependent epimerase/dehydratase family protein [Thermoleophilaceae bacterium]